MEKSEAIFKIGTPENTIAQSVEKGQYFWLSGHNNKKELAEAANRLVEQGYLEPRKFFVHPESWKYHLESGESRVNYGGLCANIEDNALNGWIKIKDIPYEKGVPTQKITTTAWIPCSKVVETRSWRKGDKVRSYNNEQSEISKTMDDCSPQ
ncbi:MAG: hypothetical protein VKL60_18675 [Sphaerospermopsis sp.]|nr:hypothetical protein [Sphaerospermopsis sp.]